MKNTLMIVSFFLAIVTAACTRNKAAQSEALSDTTSRKAYKASPALSGTSYQKGDVVPRDEVCMVNNAFMGKKQIEVNYKGRLYYGCCKMCEKRIPEDEGARTAIDPVSQKQVDKSEAIIAITGDNNQVSYFEDSANYKAFLNR